MGISQLKSKINALFTLQALPYKKPHINIKRWDSLRSSQATRFFVSNSKCDG